MDPSNNPLILKGQTVYKFLKELHIGNDGAYPQSKLRTDDGYKLFKKNVIDLRDFISKSLDYPEVQELLGEQDEITQARIRNITSPYHQYEQVDMLSADLPYNIERKKEKYEKNLKALQLLSLEEQRMLWGKRVDGSIWNEESCSLIARFILDSISLITTLAVEGKLDSHSQGGLYSIGEVFVENPKKLTGIGLNINNGDVTYDGELVVTLTGVKLDFFRVIFELCMNKRVKAQAICVAMGKPSVGIRNDYHAYLRGILSKLPNCPVQQHHLTSYSLVNILNRPLVL